MSGRSFFRDPALILTIAIILLLNIFHHIPYADFLSEDFTMKNAHVLVKKDSRKSIAYVITITKDSLFGLDGAAVLIYSIISVHNTSSSHDLKVSVIAMVHPGVKISIPFLTKLGYHVIKVPVPINVTAIKFDYLRNKIDTLEMGCCGASFGVGPWDAMALIC